jgi:glycosyltransferase involved in cell wall biosynthesis
MKKIRYVTHRPYGPLQKRIFNSLAYSFDIKFVIPSFISQTAPLVSLKKDVFTAINLLSLNIKAMFQMNNVLLDFIDCMFYPYELKHNNLIIEASTPLHIEMQWLEYPSYIWKLASRKEHGIIQKSDLVFTPNELMEKYYLSLGAKKTIVMPNYPLCSFKKEYDREITRERYCLSSDAQIALFVGGGHMREIYGLDLLLKSWQIIEKSVEKTYLFIVGPAPKDLSEQVKFLKLTHVISCGVMNSEQISQLIYDSTICLAPRTPGFPTNWYNDKDSTKISEYAAYSKPIIACGYHSSTQYHLTSQIPEEFAAGILRGLAGNVTRSVPHFWEDNITSLIYVIDDVLQN